MATTPERVASQESNTHKRAHSRQTLPSPAGGKGSTHGKFQNCHGLHWDPRVKQLVIADRENHRIEHCAGLLLLHS